MNKKIMNLEERIEILEKRISQLESEAQQEKAKTVSMKHPKKKLSPKEFLQKLQPRSDINKTFYLSSYLEQVQLIAPFNIDDLKRVYSEAKVPLPSNLNDTVNKNIKKGFLMEHQEVKDGNKAWTLTITGEQKIEEISNGQK